MARMFQSRLRMLGALAQHNGELVANGKGYLPLAQQREFFGEPSLSAQALASRVKAIETDELVEREMAPGGRKTRWIRLTEKGWDVLRERGLVPEPEPEPEPVIDLVAEDVDESPAELDIVTAARRLLEAALEAEHDIERATAMRDEYSDMASALTRALGEKRQLQVKVANQVQELRVKEKELTGLRIRVGRIERLLVEAQRVPRDSELYRVKLDELSHLMEERPHVGAGVG